MGNHLFIKTTKIIKLDSFVVLLSALIGCPNWEKRESSNYVEEEYYKCEVLGLEFTVAIADEAEFPDYSFWLALELIEDKNNLGHEQDFLDNVTDRIARILVVNGYNVIRPFKLGRADSGAIVYRINGTMGDDFKDKIITEII